MKESTKKTVLSKYLIESRKLDEAKLAVEEAIELDSTNYAAYNNRALIKYLENKPKEEVIMDYKKSLQLNPKYEITILNLTHYLLDIKDYRNALFFSNRGFEALEGDEPDSVKESLYAMRGESRQYLGDYNDAISNFKRALELNPKISGCHKCLGDCYFFGLGNIQEGIEEYSKAISIDTNYVHAYLGRAHCYEAMKDDNSMELAKQDYLKAIAIDPGKLDLYPRSDLLEKLKRAYLK